MPEITVRRIRFSFSEDIPSVFIEGDPEASYNAIALSLLLPHLEPYLIRTMRAARPHVTDPALRDDLDRFVAQEGQHYRQHRAFNDVFRARGFDGLGAWEERLSADYQRFTASKSLRWNLAYAEGFEALTTAMAQGFVEWDKAGWHPAALDLFQWHLVEEVEHRTVAFEVYEHVCGGYPYRLAVGTYAQVHFIRWILGVMNYMVHADSDAYAAFGGRAGHRRRMRALGRLYRDTVLPRVARTLRPTYSPRDIVVSDAMSALAERYTAMAFKAG